MPSSYGSQYQLQRWVVERPDELNRHLRSRNQEFAREVRKIEWLSPTRESTTELRDEAWSTVGLSEPSPEAAGWWPPRGPVWDAVARITNHESALHST